MEAGECISCGYQIPIKSEVKMGVMVTCSKCNAELEVVWLDPVELDWPFEDYDDDEDEYEYDDED
jgi:alpha-aminoadipate carrier protein LysW